MLKMFQAVLDWDAAHPDDFTAPGGARDQARQGLRALAAYTQAHADELRKQRASRGLPNKTARRPRVRLRVSRRQRSFEDLRNLRLKRASGDNTREQQRLRVSR